MFTTVTRVVLAAVAGLTLAATTAPAFAQDKPADSPPPDPLIRAISMCAEDGTSNVEVLLDDPWDPYTVTLVGSADHKPQVTEFDDEQQVHLTVFEDVKVGDYVVEVDGANQPSDGAPVKVVACEDRTPTKLELTVDVECRGGWGLATFEIANPDTGKVHSLTLGIETPSDYVREVAPGLFLRITENLFDDGQYQAVLTADGMEPIVEKFTVKCAPVNAPGIFTSARCDDKDDVTTPAVVNVTIENPSRIHSVEYTVTSGDVSKKVTVEAGYDETIDLGPFPGGDYPVTVVGSDGTETATHVVVDHCEDVRPDENGLQISVRCVDGESVVTLRYYAVGPYPAERTFKVEGRPEFDEVVEFDGDGPYRWTRYDNTFEDGAYTATLTGGGLETVEDFTVDCVEDTTTTAPPTTTESSTPATTTTPLPQGGNPPVDDLPVTGAAVGGMVALGLAALGLGGGLVLAARRRRATS